MDPELLKLLRQSDLAAIRASADPRAETERRVAMRVAEQQRAPARASGPDEQASTLRDVAEQFGVGVSDAFTTAGAGITDLLGFDPTAEKLRGLRERVRERVGEPQSGFGTAARLGGRVVGEGVQFLAPAGLAGKAAQALSFGPKAVRGIQALAGTGFDFGIGVGENPEESVAGTIAQVTGSPTFQRLSESTVGRGAVESGAGLAIGGALAGLSRAAARTSGRRAAAAEAARIAQQDQVIKAGPPVKQRTIGQNDAAARRASGATVPGPNPTVRQIGEDLGIKDFDVHVGNLSSDVEGEVFINRRIREMKETGALQANARRSGREGAQSVDLLEVLGRDPAVREISPEVSFALQDAIEESGDVIRDIDRVLLDMPEGPSKEYLTAVRDRTSDRLNAMLNREIAGASEAGRTLATFRQAAKKNDWDPRVWIAQIQKLAGIALPEELRADVLRLVAERDKDGLLDLAWRVRSMHKVTKGEKAGTLIRAGFLTNPSTDLVNLSSTAGHAAFEQGANGLGSFFDIWLGKITGLGRSRSFTLKGLARGAKKGVVGDELFEAVGFTPSVRALKGIPAEDLKTDSFKPVVYTGETRLGKILAGAANKFTRFAFGKLGAVDSVFKGSVFENSAIEQLKVLGIRAGMKGKDLDAFVARGMELIPDAVLGRALLETEEQTFKGVRKIASRAKLDAQQATFTDFGNIAKLAVGLKKSAREIPGGALPADVLIPFTATPANVLERTFMATLGGVTVTPFRVVKLIRTARKLADKTGADAENLLKLQRAVTKDMGRGMMGMSLMLTGWEMAKAGILTGSYPTQAGEQGTFDLANRRENSILLGKLWHSIEGISPMGNVALVGASMYEAMVDPENAGLGDVAGAGALRVASGVLEQPFVSGIESGLSAAVEGSRGSSSRERFFRNIVTAPIPAIVGSVARGIDPVKREVEGVIKEPIMSRIPGLSQRLPPTIDQFGQERRRDAGVLGSIANPLRSQVDRRQEDKVIAELDRLGIGLTRRGKRGARTVGDREIPEETREQHRERLLREGPQLRQALIAAVEHPVYEQLNDDAKRQWLESMAPTSIGRTRGFQSNLAGALELLRSGTP